MSTALSAPRATGEPETNRSDESASRRGPDPSTAATTLAALDEAARGQADVFRAGRGTVVARPDAVRDMLVTHDKRFGKVPLLK